MVKDTQHTLGVAISIAVILQKSSNNGSWNLAAAQNIKQSKIIEQ